MPYKIETELTGQKIPYLLRWTFQNQLTVDIRSISVAILVHLFIWVSYRLFLYYINVYRAGVPQHIFWTFTGFSTLIEPIIFYAYYLYFIPQLLEKKHIAVFVLITMGVIFLIPFPAIQYVYYLQNTLPNLPDVFLYKTPYLSHHLRISFNLFVFIGLASGARFAVDWFKNQNLQVALEKQNMLSEAALLRSQINPHFLFNTLNNIYSLSYKNDPKAPEAILKLSQLMRYMLYEASEEKVALQKEITYIQDYIDLQKLRLPTPQRVFFEMKGVFEDKLITPMLLIPFVENAFKHGVSLQNPSQILFKLEIKEDILYFYTENPIARPHLVNKTKAEKGIGLENVKQRLRLLYPNRHQISIQQNETQYIVHLTIPL